MWFQVDGAPARFSQRVHRYLNATIPMSGQDEEGQLHGQIHNPIDFSGGSGLDLVARIAIAAGDIRNMSDTFVRIRQSILWPIILHRNGRVRTFNVNTHVIADLILKAPKSLKNQKYGIISMTFLLIRKIILFLGKYFYSMYLFKVWRFELKEENI